MGQYQCATAGCAHYASGQGATCQRCIRRRAAAPQDAEREPANPDADAERRTELNTCTVCGYQAANRGVLANHVRHNHSEPDE